VANHPSALKRHRQSEKRRQRNQAIKTHLRRLVRDVRSALAANDADSATKLLASASRAIDKAATKGVLHRNNASRKIARLARAVSQRTQSAAAR
jgi:small subunit ribosomal protein S20